MGIKSGRSQDRRSPDRPRVLLLVEESLSTRFCQQRDAWIFERRHCHVLRLSTGEQVMRASYLMKVVIGGVVGRHKQTRVDSLPLALTPSVPEPATWAMMMLGFGALGFSLRRHRQNDVRQRMRLDLPKAA